jgi:hypothetical protein
MCGCNPAPPDEKPVVMNNDTEFPALVVVSTRKFYCFNWFQFDPDDLVDPDNAAIQDEIKSQRDLRHEYREGDASQSREGDHTVLQEAFTFENGEVQVREVTMEDGDVCEVGGLFIDLVDRPTRQAAGSQMVYIQVQFWKDGKYNVAWKCQAWPADVELKLSEAYEDYMMEVNESERDELNSQGLSEVPPPPP